MRRDKNFGMFILHYIMCALISACSVAVGELGWLDGTSGGGGGDGGVDAYQWGGGGECLLGPNVAAAEARRRTGPQESPSATEHPILSPILVLQDTSSRFWRKKEGVEASPGSVGRTQIRGLVVEEGDGRVPKAQYSGGSGHTTLDQTGSSKSEERWW